MNTITRIATLFGCFLSTVALAQQDMQNLMSSYGYHPQAIARIHQLAFNEGFDEQYLLSLLLATHPDTSVLAKITKPAEQTKTWAQYRPIFLNQERIEHGVAFWRRHEQTLTRAYREYGVAPEIIVAILGVETRYGKVTGNTPVFAALSTLCFDYPPRADFFCSQWDDFLHMAQQENMNPLSVQGSYAGAMGMPQFMPSSYLNDAVDYDGDGHIDLWQSADDAIGSVAHYLTKRGWQRDGKIAEQLLERPTLPDFGRSPKPYFLRKILNNVKNVTQNSSSADKEKVGSLILQGSKGEEWWLTYNNFYVITRYNTSPLYAMAVYQLAQQIKEIKTTS